MVYLLWLWQLVIHPWPGSCLNFDNPSRDKTHSHPTSKGILQGDTVWPAWTLHQIWYTGKWFPWQRFELLHPLCAVVGCWLCHAGLDVSVIVCHDIVCVTGSVMTSCDTSIWYTEWPLQRILDFCYFGHLCYCKMCWSLHKLYLDAVVGECAICGFTWDILCHQSYVYLNLFIVIYILYMQTEMLDNT